MKVLCFLSYMILNGCSSWSQETPRIADSCIVYEDACLLPLMQFLCVCPEVSYHPDLHRVLLRRSLGCAPTQLSLHSPQGHLIQQLGSRMVFRSLPQNCQLYSELERVNFARTVSALADNDDLEAQEEFGGYSKLLHDQFLFFSSLI